MALPAPDLSLTEWVVLAAVAAERDTHGFAVARAVAPGGWLGEMWSVPRPVVYRALARLVDLGLVDECGTRPGASGPTRTVLRATRRGRAAVRRWRSEPVAHVRDVRSELLVKLAVHHRAGADPADLVRSQREALAPVLEGLRARLRDAAGFDEVLASWRLESSLAVDRFLDRLRPQ